MKSLKVFSIAGAMAASAFAHQPNVELDYRFQTADGQQTIVRQREVRLPDLANNMGAQYTDPRMAKTLFVVRLGNLMKSTLEEYSNVCKGVVHPPRPIPMPRPIFPGPRPGIIRPIPRPPIEPDRCRTERIAVANKLLAGINRLQAQLIANRHVRSQKVVATMDLARKLADNMKKARPVISYGGFEGRIRTFGAPSASVGGAGLNVTAGGAQDFGFVRRLIETGRVPHQSNLTMEGFLGEFNLALNLPACNEIICAQPVVAVDGDKMFVQIAMNSKVTKESFQRKPLNLAIVLDISGSMSQKDGTEKSRLEWAKDAIAHTVSELNENDRLSIVLFDTDSEVLLAPTAVNDKEAILKAVRGLRTKGSTNLEKGLREGFELVAQNLDRLEGYENRVILVSDAGLNTGDTDPANLLQLVSDNASEGIGITAIGLGLNFNQKFTHTITRSQGGNYVFVHSGADMLRYFESFDFLVTPVAHNFRASIQLNGVEAKLVKAYGVPAKEGETLRELINVRSLFFSEVGGAIVLEYKLD